MAIMAVMVYDLFRRRHVCRKCTIPTFHSMNIEQFLKAYSQPLRNVSQNPSIIWWNIQRVFLAALKLGKKRGRFVEKPCWAWTACLPLKIKECSIASICDGDGFKRDNENRNSTRLIGHRSDDLMLHHFLKFGFDTVLSSDGCSTQR